MKSMSLKKLLSMGGQALPPEVLHALDAACAGGINRRKAMLKVSKILIDRQENPAALSEPTPYLAGSSKVTARTYTRPLTGFVSGTADALLGQRAHHRQ